MKKHTRTFTPLHSAAWRKEMTHTFIAELYAMLALTHLILASYT